MARPERSRRPWASRYDVFDVVWMAGADLRRRAARGAPRAARGVAAAAAALSDRDPRRPRAVDARVQRGLGRRDCEAAGFTLRAPPLAALAEDEVRDRAGAASSAASPIRRAAASGSARCWSGSTSTTISCLPARSAPASTPSCCLSLRARLDALEIPKPPFTKAKGLPRLRAHWVRPEIVVKVGFIEWTGHRKLRHPRLLAVQS